MECLVNRTGVFEILRMDEKIKRLVGDWMGVGVDEVRLSEEIVPYGDAPRKMHLFYNARRQRIEKFVRIEFMIARIQQQILNIEEQASPGLATDQVEKIRLRQFRVRPVEQVRDILEQEGNREA